MRRDGISIAIFIEPTRKGSKITRWFTHISQ